MSVFTFDPDPPRVSSPWQQPPDTEAQTQENGSASHSPTPANPTHSLLSEYGITRLPPEPQEGPTEYKLHLLLRPRRTHPSMSPVSSLGGSQHAHLVGEARANKHRAAALSASHQSRQDRCQQLTTQLLWRLRQSSPYHSSTSYQDIIVSPLPDDSTILTQPVRLAKLAPGLEESRGALYEIGVTDDGSLVGITQDEVDQSIATLRWMAASLGCIVEVVRMVDVGDREWEGHEPAPEASRVENLWVAEVLVRQPGLTSRDVDEAPDPSLHSKGARNPDESPGVRHSTSNQLRVTLTGPTTSGKSTLLGTLSTGALDDGHGKSRLNSLKHLHELASGLTSTVTQELIGYQDHAIINYSNPNIESWLGIHDFTKDGRLVLISDSAGHPRFRRTTLRGIIGWSPHWTLLCIAADQAAAPIGGLALPTTASPDILGATLAGADLSKAHFDLCLKLKLPMVIVITKSDLLNKDSLRRTLLPMWTAIKNAGRPLSCFNPKTGPPRTSARSRPRTSMLSRKHSLK